MSLKKIQMKKVSTAHGLCIFQVLYLNNHSVNGSA